MSEESSKGSQILYAHMSYFHAHMSYFSYIMLQKVTKQRYL